MKKKYLIPILLIVAVMSGCKSKRRLGKQEVSVDKETHALFLDIQEKEPQIKRANMSKIALKVVLNELETTVSASCRILKDSAIHLSVQPVLGIEYFKAEFTPDSIMVFDKMNRKYYVSDYELLNKYLGVSIDFNTLQSILTNRLTLLGKSALTYDLFQYQKIGDEWLLTNSNQEVKQNIILNSENRIRQVQFFPVTNRYQFVSDYSMFQEMDSIQFPQIIHMNATNGKQNVDLQFNIQKVLFNEKVTLQKTDRRKYTLGQVQQIFNQ